MNAAHTAGLLGAFKDHPDEDCSSSVAYIRAVGADRGNEICIAYSTDPATDYGAQRDADVHRLVACWNACDGIPNEVLEAGTAGGLPWNVADQIEQRFERDELLAALRRLSFAAMSRENVMGDPCSLLAAKAELATANKHACAVLAKTTGSAA